MVQCFVLLSQKIIYIDTRTDFHANESVSSIFVCAERAS